MPKSATDIMQEIVVSAVLDGVDALKAASKGLPNSLLRDINAMHANATLADLPQEVQRAIAASVQSAFVRLRKEGYSVAPQDAVRPVVSRPAPPSGAGARPGNRPRPPAGGARPAGQDRERRPPSGPGKGPRGPRKPNPGR